MMQNIAQQPTPAEQKQIAKIVKAFLVKEAGNERDADILLGQLGKIIQGQGAKLIHLGENVFLVAVQGPNQVEVQNISLSRTTLNKNMDRLMKTLRGLGVSTVDYLDPKGKDMSALKRNKITFDQSKNDAGENVYRITL